MLTLPTLDYMIGMAREKATLTGEAYAVVRMDSGDSRPRRVVPLDYVDDVEFVEFDGEIECVIQP